MRLIKKKSGLAHKTHNAPAARSESRPNKTTRRPRAGGAARARDAEQRRVQAHTPGVERPRAPPKRATASRSCRTARAQTRDRGRETRNDEAAPRRRRSEGAGRGEALRASRRQVAAAAAADEARASPRALNAQQPRQANPRRSSACATARDTAETSRDEPSLLLARPKSEPPACESFTCACTPRGGDWEVEELRLVRFQPLITCRFGAKSRPNRARLHETQPRRAETSRVCCSRGRNPSRRRASRPRARASRAGATGRQRSYA